MRTTPCRTNKLAFGSKKEAKEYMKARKNNNGFRAKHVYECPLCGTWHLTSQSAR